MPILIRIDIDSPYGKRNMFLQSLSRVTSDYNLPIIKNNVYLNDLSKMLYYLNDRKVRAYLFFRKITAPTNRILNVIKSGRHICGLHLENSRSFETFKNELDYLENKTSQKIETFSKHGSGKYRYGKYHHVPYEPDKYLEWGIKLGMKIFFGNLEDPFLNYHYYKEQLLFFPSAYWLEPYWRDTKRFTKEWLIDEAKEKDIVLLLHPENVINNKNLFSELDEILSEAESKVIEY